VALREGGEWQNDQVHKEIDHCEVNHARPNGSFHEKGSSITCDVIYRHREMQHTPQNRSTCAVAIGSGPTVPATTV
jgi:hypothetical protein